MDGCNHNAVEDQVDTDDGLVSRTELPEARTAKEGFLVGQTPLKKGLFRLGIGLISLAFLLGFADLLNLYQLPEAIHFGEAAIKTYARLAVMGCVAAAVGCWERPDQQSFRSTRPKGPNEKE